MPPPPKERADDICVWVVSILLFLSILAGGALLVLYITLPETEDTVWFPAAGMVLVAVPWLFWIMTCFYRSMTARADPSPDRSSVRIAPVAAPPAAAAASGSGTGSPVDSPGGRRRVHFGAATVVNKQEDVGSEGKQAEGEAEGGCQGTAATSNNDGSSLGSHESEMPLALSMS